MTQARELEMCQQYDASTLTQDEVARLYGVSTSCFEVSWRRYKKMHAVTRIDPREARAQAIRARHRLGMDQMAIAREVGASRQTVARVIRGEVW